MPRPPNVLTPELLKTFVTLVRVDGSVMRTAELLDINEASVSKRIKPLHEGSPPVLPKPWLEKHGKTFKLTTEGRMMLPAAEDQLRRWDHFVTFTEAGRLSALSIGCGQEAAVGIVFDALQKWRRDHPDLPVRISTPRGKARIEAVAAGLFDLALVSHDEPQIEEYSRRPLHVERLAEDPLRLVCAAKTRWSRAFTDLPEHGISAKQLLPFPLILPEPDAGLRRRLEQRLFKEQVLDKLAIVMEVGGWHAQLAYVREAWGLALLPASVVTRHGKGLLSKPLAADVAPPHQPRLIYRTQPESQSPELTEAGQAFCAALREVSEG